MLVFRQVTILCLVLAWVVATPPARADTTLGDAGHWLSYAPIVHLHHPEGGSFHVTIRAMRWPVEKWNRPEVRVRMLDPFGEVIHEATSTFADAKPDAPAGTEPRVTIRIDDPDAPPGVYRLEVNHHPDTERRAVRGVHFWLETDLPRAVVHTGDPAGHAMEDRWLVVQASVPRWWWFWVPEGVKGFSVKSQRAHRYMSQREDPGIFIVSPRGQRMRAIFGQADTSEGWAGPGADHAVHVPVEPGSDGRFWAMQIRHGDAHHFSNTNVTLHGVPPYVARDPESWFNPETGEAPTPVIYDDDPFMQFARTDKSEDWPGLEHFSPAPALGDPDGHEIIGSAMVGLHNPEGRPLKLRVGTYVPAWLGRDSDEPTATARVSRVSSVRPGDAAMTFPLMHLHHADGFPIDAPMISSPGVHRLRVDADHRWCMFTYPAVPMVLMPEHDHAPIRLRVGGARHWYFRVPAGTERFTVAAETAGPDEVLDMSVHAPDQMVARVYGHDERAEVTVPPGRDGRIWFLRVDVGSSSRFPQRVQGVRDIPALRVKLRIQGVPARLSPTRSQWFSF